MLRAGLAFWLAAVGLAACSSSSPGGGQDEPLRIAFLQDLSVPSHVDLVSPSFLAFDLALHDVLEERGVDREVEVVQMDTGGDPQEGVVFANEVAADPSYVAAVAAPFWSEPPEVASILAEAGVPTLSLSPQSSAPVADGTDPAATGAWRRFVPDASLQVEALEEVIQRAVGPGGSDDLDAEPICVFGEDWSYSDALQRELAAALPPAIVTTVPPAGDIDAAVADVDRGCSLVVWTGGPDGAVELASALHDAGLVRGRPVDFGADALKTVIPPTVPNHEGVVVGGLTCPCTDVSTRTTSEVRAFINAYQAANGLTPGIYAAEAWDAASALASELAAGADDRGQVAAWLEALVRVEGVARVYTFDERGELVDPRVHLYVAAGSRWLRIGD